MNCIKKLLKPQRPVMETLMIGERWTRR